MIQMNYCHCQRIETICNEISNDGMEFIARKLKISKQSNLRCNVIATSCWPFTSRKTVFYEKNCVILNTSFQTFASTPMRHFKHSCHIVPFSCHIGPFSYHIGHFLSFWTGSQKTMFSTSDVVSSIVECLGVAYIRYWY